MKVGDELICIFNQVLPGNDHAPKLELGKRYKCESTYVDKAGFLHIDVGLALELNWVKGYQSDETLPPNIHWCHPNRFIKVPPVDASILMEVEDNVY